MAEIPRSGHRDDYNQSWKVRWSHLWRGPGETVGEAVKKRWIREPRGEGEKGEGTEKGENRREVIHKDNETGCLYEI